MAQTRRLERNRLPLQIDSSGEGAELKDQVLLGDSDDPFIEDEKRRRILVYWCGHARVICSGGRVFTAAFVLEIQKKLTEHNLFFADLMEQNKVF